MRSEYVANRWLRAIESAFLNTCAASYLATGYALVNYLTACFQFRLVCKAEARDVRRPAGLVCKKRR